MKVPKSSYCDELEFLEKVIELLDDKLKELTIAKAKYMTRCEELRKELQNDE